MSRPEQIELVAGPFDGQRFRITMHCPVFRITEPAYVTALEAPLRRHLYTRTAGRTFDGLTRFLWQGLEDGEAHA